MTGDIPTANVQMNATNCIGGTYQQCSSCFQWHYGLHVCPSNNSISWVSTAPALTAADVERIVAKALEDHDKKYLAIIETLAHALAGEK